MRLSFLVILSLVAGFAMASHNKAGEITYRLVSGLTYEITVVTYTENGNPRSRQADRDQLEVFWGDFTSSVINRVSKENLPNTTWKNTYVGTHLYAGPGTFKVYLVDPNRIEGVRNMDNSFNTAFYLECTIKINPFLGVNRSPVLLIPPIDYACTLRKFVHNPGAYDADGDSLIYSIIAPKQALNTDVNGFFIPQATTSFTIDRYNGELVWDSPVPGQDGKYNIAILIQEFRNGQEIGSIIRDMQIVVVICNNDPPILTKIQDTCIEVGKTYTTVVKAIDPNVNDLIKLTAYGAPFIAPGTNATLTPFSALGKDSIKAVFSWTPSCNQIRKTPYEVVCRAEDQHAAPDINLVDMKFFNIRVVGPAPQNPTLAQFEDGFILKWNKDSCNEAAAYNIYRRIDSSKWKHNYCETGVPSYTGYKLYHTDTGLSNNQYYDNDGGLGLVPGTRYCYRVTSVYSPKGANNAPIFSEAAEGYSSIEVCAEITKDRPVITNVSVLKTDNDTGKIWLAWSKPLKMDSVYYPGPYKYVIYRSPDINGGAFVPVDSLSNSSFYFFNDSAYTDAVNLNTLGKQYSYKIEFYSDSFGLKRQYIGKSRPASSIYLSCIPDDEALELVWNDNVQWKNVVHTIYKWNEQMLTFDSIGSSPVQRFRDEGLINGKTYKYYIKSKGEFTVPGYVYPVINLSQEAEGIPADTTSPCPPLLSAATNCVLFNTSLKWNNPNNSCAKDIVGYNVYCRTILDTAYILIASNNSATDTTFFDARPILTKSVAACYLVTAIDSFNNESEFSNGACVDNCPEYRLPNVFTPGNDSLNDLFGPFPYRYVKKVDMSVYNRWGQLVFETHDPDINWDGREMNSTKEVPDGVYFYICTVHELRLEGIKKRILKGTVQVIR